MEDRGREHRVGSSESHAIGQMLQGTDSTRGDYRNWNRVDDRTGQFEIEALTCSVTVHARQQDLARAERSDSAGPVDRVKSAVTCGRRTYEPPPGAGSFFSFAPGVDRHDDALGAIAALAASTGLGSCTAAVLIEILSRPR